MIGINTNLGSLIIQSNLKKSTNALNTAIERMTTGFKINRAGDNAANYSISTNMSTEISAYQVAEDNANIGLEMLNTASNSLSLIDNALSRLRALAIQTSNDTYGGQSMEAINSEANALIDEIEREYNSAEYNGIKLFQNSETSPSGGITADLINPVQQRDVSGMTALKDVDSNTTISSGTYSISSAEELAKLAEMTNAGRVTGGEFVLGADIDLSGYRSNGGWTPIGYFNSSSDQASFDGIFDGNGYVISNLYINRSDGSYQGLFGISANGTFKNIALENVDISANIYVGGLVAFCRDFSGSSSNVTISNSCVIGTVTAQQYSAGGLVGGIRDAELTITDSYSTGTVASQDGTAGGLAGLISNSKLTINGSYSSGTVSANKYTGGLAGEIYSGDLIITGCYSTDNVVAQDCYAGGLAGGVVGGNLTITDSYSTGNITAQQRYTGGLVGIISNSDLTITSSYSSGIVSTNLYSGGLAGYAEGGNLIIMDSYSIGDVIAQDSYAGGLTGRVRNVNLTITDSYSTGTATAQNYAGGLAGAVNDGDFTISGSYVLGQSDNLDGIFVGGIASSTFEISDSYYSSYYDGKGLEFVAGYGNQTSSGGATGGAASYNGGVPFTYSPSAAADTGTSQKNLITLQIGINSSESSQISIDTGFSPDNLDALRDIGTRNGDYVSMIDDLIKKVSAKQTELGATENRLVSALEEISIRYENLVSSRSTIRDADIAEVSSEYIRQQILQQAAATLLATANQTPAIALQLL